MFNGKTILFIAPNMFDYPAAITQEMEYMGGKVIYIPDYPQQLSARIIRNLNKIWYWKIVRKYLNNILQQNKGKHIDYLFIIGRAIINCAFLQEFRKQHPEAFLISYQWDSNTLHPYFHLLKYFDKCFSFDPVDCQQQPALRYLPLFYHQRYESLRHRTDKEIFQLCHIGTLHPGRYEWVMKVDEFCKKENINFSYYLYIPFSSYLKFLLKGKNFKQGRFKKLRQQEILSYYAQSKVILDLPQIGQSGFTMRTFEVLGAGKKLLTTNKNIVTCDFYNTQMVEICDFQKQELFPSDFITVDEVVSNNWLQRMANYSLREWLNTIFFKS